MKNNQKMRDESIKMIKGYYSKKLHKMIKVFIDLNETTERQNTGMDMNRREASPIFRDTEDLI